MTRRDTIFKSKQEMVETSNSEDVCRVALSKEEARANLVPASLPNSYRDVQNVIRARRGYTTY